MNQLSVCSNREIGFNFDLVRCWKTRSGLDHQHQERQIHRAQQNEQEQREDCLQESPTNILNCATDINSSLLKTVLFVLIIGKNALGVVHKLRNRILNNFFTPSLLRIPYTLFRMPWHNAQVNPLLTTFAFT